LTHLKFSSFFFFFFSCQRNQIDKSALLHSKFATMTLANCYALWIGIPYWIFVYRPCSI
jgi:hypothetical protein